MIKQVKLPIDTRVGKSLREWRSSPLKPNEFRIVSPDLVPNDNSKFFVIQAGPDGRVVNVIFLADESPVSFDIGDGLVVYDVPSGVEISYTWKQN